MAMLELSQQIVHYFTDVAGLDQPNAYSCILHVPDGYTIAQLNSAKACPKLLGEYQMLDKTAGWTEPGACRKVTKKRAAPSKELALHQRLREIYGVLMLSPVHNLIAVSVQLQAKHSGIAHIFSWLCWQCILNSVDSQQYLHQQLIQEDHWRYCPHPEMTP